MKPVIIGDCTLYLGDCLEIMPTLGKVDAVVTDPPYGIGGSNGTIGKKRGKGAYISAFDDTPSYIEKVVATAIRLALSKSTRGALTPGFRNMFKYPEPKDVGSYYMPSGSGLNYWGRITDQPIFYYGDDPLLGKTIQYKSHTIREPMEKIDHPCPKPIMAWTWLVKRVSLDGETILDPFMGSGTTGVACAKLGRKFIGIELEPKYFDIACERIQKAYDQPDMFVEQPKKAVQDKFEL